MFDLAQISPDAIGVFSEKGVMGAFIAILISAVAFLAHQLLKAVDARNLESDKRVEDAKEHTKTLLQSAEASWRLSESHGKLSASSEKLVESVTKLLNVIESRKI